MVFLTNVDRILLTKKENSNKKTHTYTHICKDQVLLVDLRRHSISNLGCEEEIDVSTLYISSLQLQVCTK